MQDLRVLSELINFFEVKSRSIILNKTSILSPLVSYPLIISEKFDFEISILERESEKYLLEIRKFFGRFQFTEVENFDKSIIFTVNGNSDSKPVKIKLSFVSQSESLELESFIVENYNSLFEDLSSIEGILIFYFLVKFRRFNLDIDFIVSNLKGKIQAVPDIFLKKDIREVFIKTIRGILEKENYYLKEVINEFEVYIKIKDFVLYIYGLTLGV